MSEYHLDELCEILDSKRVPLSGIQRAKRQGPYPYYGAQSVIDYVDDYLLDGEYLLVAEDGANLVTRTQDIANLVNGKIWVNNHAHILGYNGKCPLQLLGFILNHCNISPYVTGCAQPKLNQDNLRRITIKLPERVDEVASILSSLDDKIAVNRRICENLEAQAQALFKHWFIDFAPFKDGKFVESELGMIPEGLIYKRIEDMLHTLETGKRPAGGVKGIDNGVPSIGAENIKGLGCYDYSKTKFVPKEYAYSMKKGKINGYELLIYKDGGKPGYFIPNFAIFGEGYPYKEMCLNEHVFKLDFGNKGYSLFAYFFFKTKQIMSYLNAQGAKAAIPGINSKDIEVIMMPSLENECVQNYCNEVEDVITQILVLSKESSRLSTLRDTLLPKLMSGQIKV